MWPAVRHAPTGHLDAHFAVPRLAEIYDALHPDRSDLDVYGAIVSELGASAVLDVGCGTGTFACLLSRLGKAVTGLDPASASLDVARRKPGSDRVRWIEGDLTALPPLEVDLVVMTGNVAQIFLSDPGLDGDTQGRPRRAGAIRPACL
jgi:SAM-dependent methyltransferase